MNRKDPNHRVYLKAQLSIRLLKLVLNMLFHMHLASIIFVVADDVSILRIVDRVLRLVRRFVGATIHRLYLVELIPLTRYDLWVVVLLL